ncbi:MAG: hypothetical protein ACKPJ8_11080, partial [Dolichospermum sp.]
MRYILSPLLAPPSFPPLRGEEKDKLLILEGVGGGVTLYLITSVSAVSQLIVDSSISLELNFDMQSVRFSKGLHTPLL